MPRQYNAYEFAISSIRLSHLITIMHSSKIDLDSHEHNGDLPFVAVVASISPDQLNLLTTSTTHQYRHCISKGY
ncbi:hypothetical protein BM1_10782 [Bipolaris maydis]|nr:hypothetical protein BM1_10782 [Bipolaris maydis]